MCDNKWENEIEQAIGELKLYVKKKKYIVKQILHCGIGKLLLSIER